MLSKPLRCFVFWQGCASPLLHLVNLPVFFDLAKGQETELKGYEQPTQPHPHHHSEESRLGIALGLEGGEIQPL
jgi:hypothetical protein